MEDVSNQDGSQKDPSMDGTSSPTITYDEKQILNDVEEVKLKKELLDDHIENPYILGDEDVNSHIKREESCESQIIKTEDDQEYNKESQKLKENSNLYASKLPSLALACLNQDRDAIIRLATEEGGLVDDSIRQMACALIVDNPLHYSVSRLIIAKHRANTSWIHFIWYRE